MCDFSSSGYFFSAKWHLCKSKEKQKFTHYKAVIGIICISKVQQFATNLLEKQKEKLGKCLQLMAFLAVVHRTVKIPLLQGVAHWLCIKSMYVDVWMYMKNETNRWVERKKDHTFSTVKLALMP